MKITHLMTAVAASALFAGAAMAQDATTSAHAGASHDANMPAGPVNPSSADSTVSTPSTTTTTTTTSADGAVSAGAYATGASVTTSTVTNGPVPDTAENRAKYGAPMSNAGKRTAPAGN
jgi:hypothetical protein